MPVHVPSFLFPSAIPLKRSGRFLFAWSQIGTPRLHHRAPSEINGVGTRASTIHRRLLLIYRVKVHGEPMKQRPRGNRFVEIVVVE